MMLPGAPNIAMIFTSPTPTIRKPVLMFEFLVGFGVGRVPEGPLSVAVAPDGADRRAWC